MSNKTMDTVDHPTDVPPASRAANTAVTTTAAAFAAALVVIGSHLVAFYGGGDLSPDFRDAVMVVLIGFFGWFMHSRVITEDRAAFHQFVLARLGSHAPLSPIDPPPLSRTQVQRPDWRLQTPPTTLP